MKTCEGGVRCELLQHADHQLNAFLNGEKMKKGLQVEDSGLQFDQTDLLYGVMAEKKKINFGENRHERECKGMNMKPFTVPGIDTPRMPQRRHRGSALPCGTGVFKGVHCGELDFDPG